LEIVQEAATPPDELQQPATRVMIPLRRAEMLGQLVDRRAHRDLTSGDPVSALRGRSWTISCFSSWWPMYLLS
jgi:hypothetical protein